MLTDYDASAVARVMGIAFLRHPEAGSASTAADTFRGQAVPARGGATMEAEAGRHPVPGQGDAAAHADCLIEQAVQSGLPRQALRKVAECLAGADKAKIAALEWEVVPKTTLERRQTRLSPPESERTERLARLFVHARRALGSEAEAREFLTMPHPQLEGRSPLEASRSDLGTRRVEGILNALEYGLAL